MRSLFVSVFFSFFLLSPFSCNKELLLRGDVGYLECVSVSLGKQVNALQ